jgi:hypothetical protein
VPCSYRLTWCALAQAWHVGYLEPELACGNLLLQCDAAALDAFLPIPMDDYRGDYCPILQSAANRGLLEPSPIAVVRNAESDGPLMLEGLAFQLHLLCSHILLHGLAFPMICDLIKQSISSRPR